ncbi:hypothetical protein ABZV77_04480 [Streptomyces sp. NPDC004732]|uniref:hypothetical protein n=1 Tax=Streptomyces sp. NPDC004732 TaxID=3154290 RepID=UPI0033A88C9C
MRFKKTAVSALSVAVLGIGATACSSAGISEGECRKNIGKCLKPVRDDQCSGSTVESLSDKWEDRMKVSGVYKSREDVERYFKNARLGC